MKLARVFAGAIRFSAVLLEISLLYPNGSGIVINGGVLRSMNNTEKIRPQLSQQ